MIYKGDKMKLIAHRGFHNLIIPENSLESFNHAINLKLPIELDVRLTKDEEVIVFHDAFLKRMTGINDMVKNLTLKEIKQLKLLNSKETIPTLEEVLILVNKKVPLYIELKNNKVGILEDKVIDLLKNYNNFYLMSFNEKSVYYIKKQKPNYQVGILLLCYRRINYKKIDFICCPVIESGNKNIQKYKDKKELLGWNVKSKNQIKETSKLVDGWIIDINQIND
jgi:glycerophosphoryl diester phosphodiesterase